MIRRRLFASSAIALALTLWSVLDQSAAAVRRQISPDSVLGATAMAGWSALRRWTRAIRGGALFTCARPCPPDWNLRRVAECAVQTIASIGPHAVSPGALVDRVFIGAAHAA